MKILPFMLLILIMPLSKTSAHIEDELFAEHPPKTSFGITSVMSKLSVNSNQYAYANTLFGEYSFNDHFSIGAGIPSGYFDGEYIISDMVIALKSMFNSNDIKFIPTFSVELPTGTEPATTDHTEIVGIIFIEKKIPNFHFYGYPGIRFSFDSHDEDIDNIETEDGHGSKINVFSPHTDNEVLLTAGVSYWISEIIGVDGRLTGYYEDFEELVAKPQAGMVMQISEDVTYKGSISAYYVPDGIREGWGAGIFFYVGL